MVSTTSILGTIVLGDAAHDNINYHILIDVKTTYHHLSSSFTLLCEEEPLYYGRVSPRECYLPYTKW
jgi:hypothetical protein